MRIAEIHVFQVDLPVPGTPYRMSGGAHSSLDSTVVQVVTDTGATGWGETCPDGRLGEVGYAFVVPTAGVTVTGATGGGDSWPVGPT